MKDEVPKELQEIKTMLVEGTNPDVDKSRFLNDLMVFWGELNNRVKIRTSRFFNCKSFSHKEDFKLEIFFVVYKGSPPDYGAILDSLQELLPNYGVRMVSPEVQ